MTSPDLFADPDLEPSAKRLLYLGCMAIAEDSGCLVWKPGLLKGLVLPYDAATVDDVQSFMAELVDEGRAWTYQRDGKQFAFLPDFPSWQGRLTRWGAPEAVPLPSGISFTPYEAKERQGSGRYEWPSSREALDPTELEVPKESEALDLNVLDLKEPASSQRAASEQLPLAVRTYADQHDFRVKVSEHDDLERLRAAYDALSAPEAREAAGSAYSSARRASRDTTVADLTFSAETLVERRRSRP